MFVEEYCADKNATQAAKRAGYPVKSAGEIGSRLLKKVSISRAVERELARQAKRIQVDAGVVLTEYARIATADARKAFGRDGRLKRIHEMPEDLTRAISSFEVTTDDTGVSRLSKVKFWPKTAALEALGKHLQLFVEKVELGSEGGPVTITIGRTVKPDGGQ